MSFQSLPREIRNEIYFFVTHAERDPPSPHDESILSKYHDEEKQQPIVWWNIYYEDRQFHPPYTNLSCTSHQIRAEVQEAVSAVRDAGHLTYKLDLIADGSKVYATWLSVPAPTKYLAELRVDFRAASNRDRRWFGDGGPGIMTRNLGRLLSRFVAHGPSFFGELETASQSEWHFDMLSVRIVDVLSVRLAEEDDFEAADWAPDSGHDWNGLIHCAEMLAGYNIIGHRVKVMEVRHGDAVTKFPLRDVPPSEEHLALWSGYAWYRPSSSS